jgi:hypothetical protein
MEAEIEKHNAKRRREYADKLAKLPFSRCPGEPTADEMADLLDFARRNPWAARIELL